MGKYSELKEILKTGREILEKKIASCECIENKNEIYNYLLTRMSLGTDPSIVRDLCKELAKLKECKTDELEFDHLEEEYISEESLEDIIETMSKYYLLYQARGIDKFDFNGFLKYLNSVPSNAITRDYVDSLRKEVEYLRNFKASQAGLSNIKSEESSAFIKSNFDRIFVGMILSLAGYVIKRLKLELYVFDLDNLPSMKRRYIDVIGIVKKYDKKISDDELLSNFSEEELIDLKDMIDSITDDEDHYDNLIEQIRSDQEAKRQAQEAANPVKKVAMSINKKTITFDNLDMSKFTDEEQEIINAVKMIVSSIEVGTKTYENVSLTTEARLKAYEKDSLKNILSDVNYLLSQIYDNKDTVIAIFKEIIKKYINFVKNEHIKSLREINVTSSTLVNRISKECFANDYENSMRGIEHLTKVQEDINDCIPMAEYVLSEEGFSEYDEAIASNIVRAKEIISLVIRETQLKGFDYGASNLVFNLDNSKITDSDFVKEYKNALSNLEYRKLCDMRMLSTESSLYPLRTETEDFVTYIKRITGRRPRFVPCIYSGSGTIKTVIMEFTPSLKVREHLEKKYGILNDGNYYGVYGMITDSEIKRNGYSNLANELVKRFSDIQKIGEIFVSEKPTDEELDYLDSVIENGLKDKEELRFGLFDVQK